MQHHIIHNTPFTYRLIRSRKRRKTLSLSIAKTGIVVVQAPYGISLEEIEAFLERKKGWLAEKRRQLHERRTIPLSDSLPLGTTLLFLGQAYPLISQEEGLQVGIFSFRDDQFVLNSRILYHRRAIIRAWYERRATAYFEKRVDHFSRAFGLQASGIRISRAEKRWGSCSAKNSLAFAWRLMMAPPSVIDYVVVHELAHIREKNHGRSFWTLVASMMPDYSRQRQWLKDHGHRLFL